MTSSIENTKKYDLGSFEFYQDPYNTYRKLLCGSPYYWSDENSCWFISKYRDITNCLLDKRFSADRISGFKSQLPVGMQEYLKPLMECLEKWVLFLNPPQHATLRRKINIAFSSKKIAQMELYIDRLTSKFIDKISYSNDVDIVRDFAYPIPACIIATMLGVPESDIQKIKSCTDSLVRYFNQYNNSEVLDAARNSIIEITDYLKFTISKQKEFPQDNLMGSLIGLQSEDRFFTDSHLIANCVALLFAGHETTTNAIGNTVYLIIKNNMLSNTCQYNSLNWSGLVSESLRLETPVQRISRQATENIKIGSRFIQAGQQVFFLLGAANRDPDIFNDPDLLDCNRKEPNLAFGHGPHYCSGMNMAKFVTECTVRELFKKLGPLSLKQPILVWRKDVSVRALCSLPVQLQ